MSTGADRLSRLRRGETLTAAGEADGVSWQAIQQAARRAGYSPVACYHSEANAERLSKGRSLVSLRVARAPAGLPALVALLAQGGETLGAIGEAAGMNEAAVGEALGSNRFVYLPTWHPSEDVERWRQKVESGIHRLQQDEYERRLAEWRERVSAAPLTESAT